MTGYSAQILLRGYADGADDELLDSRIDASIRAFLGSKGYKYGGKGEKYFTAYDYEATKTDEYRRRTCLHLGAIPREVLVSYLWGSGDDRVEKADDYVTGALLSVSPTCSFSQLEISPVLWVVGQRCETAGNSIERAISVANYERDLAKYNSELTERFGDRPLTLRDVKSIEDDILNKLLSPVEKAGKLSSGDVSDCLNKIYIDQLVTSAKKDLETASLHLSFYAKEIKRIADLLTGCETLDELKNGQLSLVLQYLKAGPEENSDRVELLSDNEDDTAIRQSCLSKVLGPGSVPLGRWPSRYSLSLMQQIAVNLAFGPKREALDPPIGDIMSVNGPPGTGKTTLLKDLIAANVVEKAHILAGYDRPDDAFERLALGRAYPKLGNEIYRFKDECINDFGIVVCSSNNDAVENISKELPSADGLLKGICESERDEFLNDNLSTMRWKMTKNGDARNTRDLYFSYAAFNQFRGNEHLKLEDYDASNDENLHILMSARLGSSSNRGDFNYKTLNPLLTNLKNWEGRYPSSRYKTAQKRFNEQYEKVKRLLDNAAHADGELTNCQEEYEKSKAELETITKELRASKESYERYLGHGLQLIESRASSYGVRLGDGSPKDLKRCFEELFEQYAKYAEERKHLENCLTNAKRIAESQDKSVRVRWFGGGHRFEKAQASEEHARHKLAEFDIEHRREAELGSFLSDLEVVVEHCISEYESYGKLKSGFQQAQEVCDTAKPKLEEAEFAAKSARALVMGSDADYSAVDGILANDLVSDDQRSRKRAHLFNPYAGETLMRERDLLFLRALQLTREFILSSTCVKTNLQYYMVYWTGKVERESVAFSPKDRKVIAPITFQTLNLVTPVISTTFASVQSLFRDLEIKAENKKAPLGLLVIDEAGQALPYAALGVLARCRRAMIVGDPFQTEPIYPQETGVLRDAIVAEMDRFYTGDTASVQQFGDAVNPYGQYRRQDDGDSWIGCPLTIHRRCVSPMFDISNEVSYQGSMLNETPSLDPAKPADKKKLDSFYLPSSQWLNVIGSERGNKDHYVEEQGKRVVEIIQSAFEKRPDKNKLPSIFVISPFSSVARAIKKVLKGIQPERLATDKNGLDDFVNNNIGTVHKFQGKEALEVVFVLGCDSTAKGAIKFVGPNIVNVAASRAKQRLYVVGDITVWNDNPSVKVMRRILDTAWVEHWEKCQQSKDPSERRLAQQMMPLPESMPRRKDAWDQEILDTSIFESNLRSSTQFLSTPITDQKCRQLGFLPLSTLGQMLGSRQKEFDEEVDLALHLYLFFGFGRLENDEEVESAKSCHFATVVNIFAAATENYLKDRFLPAVKEAMPDYRLAKDQKPLGDWDRLELGRCAHIIKSKQGWERLANSVKLADPASRGGDGAWWKDLSKSFDRVATIRNPSVHEYDSSESRMNKVLACMGFKGECNWPQIIRNGEVYDAVARGARMERRGDSVERDAASENTEPKQPKAGIAECPRVILSSEERPGPLAPFSLADMESQKDDKCLSFGGLSSQDEFAALKQVVCGGKYYSSAALKLLVKAGYVRDCEFDGISGKFPTQAGAELGIRWRRYDNGAGVVFDPCAQAWLKENLLDLHKRYGGEA